LIIVQPEQFKSAFGPATSYYPQLAKVTGGVTAAILIVYLLEQQAETWQAYDAIAIERETGLTAAEQELARDRLSQRGFVQVRLVGAKNLEFCLNLAEFQQKLDAFARLIFSPPEPPPPPIRDPYFGNPRQPFTVPVSPHYQFQGPWTTPDQFEAFQRALLAHFTAQGKPNPGGYMFKIIDSMSKGIVSPYWDEFVQGLPLGSLQQAQQEWEIEPGVAYPAFEEERIQYYIHKGEPLEAAVARARADLRNPVLAKDLWEGFLRKCDRLAKDAQRHQKQGVQTPYLPSAFTTRSQPTKAEIVEQFQAVSQPPSSLPQPPDAPEKPSLKTLETLCRNALGRGIVAKQLAEHPEWGYRLVDGQVVEDL
jgi:hypothetical protein